MGHLLRVIVFTPLHQTLMIELYLLSPLAFMFLHQTLASLVASHSLVLGLVNLLLITDLFILGIDKIDVVLVLYLVPSHLDVQTPLHAFLLELLASLFPVCDPLLLSFKLLLELLFVLGGELEDLVCSPLSVIDLPEELHLLFLQHLDSVLQQGGIGLHQLSILLQHQ